MKPVLAAWTLGLCLLAACEEPITVELPTRSTWSPSTEADASARISACDQAVDGTPCGIEQHCIFNACVENACGDGVRAGLEACDDGNERDHDGCDARCRLESPPGCGNGAREPGEECEESENNITGDCTVMCTKARCGDAILSPGEECDDGNLSNNDRCSSRCRTIAAPCGNGKIDAREECDDGNTVDGDGCEANCKPTMDAGLPSSDLDSGLNEEAGVPVVPPPKTDASVPTVDSGSPPVVDAEATRDSGTPRPPFGLAQEKAACAACREQECTVYQGAFDLVSGCFKNPDPTFVQQCVDVLDCAYKNKCGYTAVGAAQCFCGSVDLNTCQQTGKADGPCQAEWYAAARTTSLATLIGSFSDVSLPSGVAYYFQECDRDLCPVCKP